MDWSLFGALAGGAALLVGRRVVHRSEQAAIAEASGLRAVADLAHLPVGLQATALWAISEGGFEERVVHGVLSRGTSDIDVTAFEMETLRERRGEWAFLPVVPPFRIGGEVSVVVCQIDRELPHVLFKREGRGDELRDDGMIERAHLAKLTRDALALARSYPAELPITLPAAAVVEPALPAGWRAYSSAPACVSGLIVGGFGAVLERSGRRDLVIELLGRLVVIYPAARAVEGADALADLAATGVAIAAGVLAATPALVPRGQQ